VAFPGQPPQPPDAGGDGDYETAVPSDEYRQLTKTAGGWELRDLDGMDKSFDTSGRWTQTVDRNGDHEEAAVKCVETVGASVAMTDELLQLLSSPAATASSTS
jgi:hypothetical protein